MGVTEPHYEDARGKHEWSACETYEHHRGSRADAETSVAGWDRIALTRTLAVANAIRSHG